MAEDLVIKIESEIEQLGNAAKSASTHLSDEQSKKVEEGLEAAKKALNVKDWDTVRSNINKVSKTITQAIASTSHISEALQKALDLKSKIEADINNMKDRLSAIRSKYTDSSMKTFTKEGAKKTFEDWTAQNGAIKGSNGQALTREEAIEHFYKALELAGGKITKITDEIAKQAGLEGRSDSFAMNRYLKEEKNQQAKDIKEAGSLETKIAGEENKLPDLEQEIEKLSTASEKSADSLEELYKAIIQLTSAANKDIVEQKTAERKEGSGSSGAAQSPEDFKGVNTQLDKQSTSLGKVIKQFSVYAILLKTVKKALNEAAKTIKDLDKYLTEQAMVTGKTRRETYALLESYQTMASELGATTKEIAEVTTQFLRQGKSTGDALTLTRAAVSAAKVAGISGSESVNYLTTALNGFQLAAEDAMRVSDKFAAIAAQSATSYEEIATALSKVAAQANMAGMSIDFTTALLAKGIETTREPAESIGTALKTIIARMREITDYGKTLEDGMDINNVETQLAYVGIALRNANGELRSTEEVLNDLGEKWDTLSSNQQAAVAKALAGTRQQSRLIAMMSDYERVTELQEIAQRSAGATAAQLGTYMEGMEYALNKVSVAWEKIVSSLTNSDFIINIINIASKFLDKLGDFLSTDFGIVTTLTIISTLGLSILGNKMREMELSRLQQRYILEENKQQNLKNIALAKENIEKLKVAKQNAKARVDAANERKIQLKKLSDIIQQRKAQGAIVTASEAYLKKEQMANEEELAAANEAYTQASNNLSLEEDRLNIMEKQQTILDSQTSLVDRLKSGFSGLLTPLYMIVGAWKLITAAINAARRASKKKHQQEVSQDASEVPVKASKGAGEIISQLGVWGIPIAAAVLLALAGIALGISAAINKSKQGTDSAASNINQLSNEIYKLTEKANAIKSIEKQYDALDQKIIKTIEDQEKMNELLDSAGDKLDSTRKKDNKGNEISGTSEQDIYKNLSSDKMKREYLEKIEGESIRKANQKRREQIEILQGLTEKQRQTILTSKDNANYLMVQDALYAKNNNTLYEYIDTLGDVGEGVERLTQNILEQMDAEEAYKYATDESGSAIKRLADTINNANTIIGDSQVSLAEVLDSTKYSLKDKISAYKELYESIEALGDDTLLQSFKEAYSQWGRLEEVMSESAIDFMDRIGISIDKMNAFGQALNKLGLSTDQAAERISSMFDLISNGADVSSTITRLFADVLAPYRPDSDDYKIVYNSILNAYQKAAGTGLLNMGQNLKSLQSQINSLYETASKWSTMSKDEQSSFIQDNYELFQGENGASLFRAFETGDYKQIQAALATNEVLKEQIRLRLEQLRIDLSIAEAATDRNEAEIAWLKEQIKALEDYEDAASSVYQAELSLRLEQENKQLEIYKDYLEKQKDALTESLDKRKEAYQKYFDAINQEAEDEDYEEQAAILSANLSKLSSSTDASSRAQSKELEQQLQELEKERLETLRERAQEAVLNNLDDEVSQINDKFDKLLENQAALLDYMNKEIAENPSDFVSRLAASGIENMTATQAEDYIKNNLIPAFDSSISGDILDGIKVRQEGGSLFLTLNNQEIELSNNNQQELSMTILAALRAMGISI